MPLSSLVSKLCTRALYSRSVTLVRGPNSCKWRARLIVKCCASFCSISYCAHPSFTSKEQLGRGAWFLIWCRSNRGVCQAKDLRVWHSAYVVALSSRNGYGKLQILELWLRSSHQQTFQQHPIPDQTSWGCRSILHTCIILLWCTWRRWIRCALCFSLAYKSRLVYSKAHLKMLCLQDLVKCTKNKSAHSSQCCLQLFLIKCYKISSLLQKYSTTYSSSTEITTWVLRTWKVHRLKCPQLTHNSGPACQQLEEYSTCYGEVNVPFCADRYPSSVDAVVAYINSSSPYWSRKEGADHILTFSQDNGSFIPSLLHQAVLYHMIGD